MSGGNNATISMPGPGWGPGWAMLWPDAFDNFQLDIVGLLAILGEGSVAANAQVAALSNLSFLPRLMPAPQALLWPNRLVTLEPTTKATVTAVVAGNIKDHIHHVASVLLSDAEAMPKHMVRCVKISKDNRMPTTTSWSDTVLRGQPGKAKARAQTQSPLATPSVKVKAFGPLAMVTLLGCLLSITLFTLSIVFGDGMSMIASILLSLLTTLTGIGNSWTLKLPKRSAGSTPPGDTVIRYPNGSFLVIKCDEDVARELFWAPEEIDYMVSSTAAYRLISLSGTIILMLGVIALANARLELQFAWAGAYVIINAAYWVGAAVPPRLHWDFSCYTLEEQGVASGSANANFTEALWRAIMLTQSTEWVKNGNAAPRTKVWDAWLLKAEEQSQLAKEQPGKVQGPYWKDNGKVWATKEEWDAKGAWDTLNHDTNNIA
ncbi:hypothetical protein LTR56_022393 [Elasticomyces elasticus]|nr:hypothetical protein LTR56_022393 [Elasticomyces elasticus]KAK3633198.1 hypothetical protein LTR22_020274 [Elasticomyces elasticus]KAK4922385.1 hypothetical protein LTR49_010250 [Elasticomyces elasticus]KAK5765266.1 hypothetical protein LTS12_004523 [Elasticomyces elasticus]